MDGIKANDFTRQVETKNLFFAILVNDVTFKATGSNGGDGLELVAGTKNVFARLNGPGFINNMLKLLEASSIESTWQTQITERTLAASNL